MISPFLFRSQLAVRRVPKQRPVTLSSAIQESEKIDYLRKGDELAAARNNGIVSFLMAGLLLPYHLIEEFATYS